MIELTLEQVEILIRATDVYRINVTQELIDNPRDTEKQNLLERLYAVIDDVSKKKAACEQELSEANKILFRFHRGGYKESMATVTEVTSLADLINHITLAWDVHVSRITISPYCHDSRNGWDTHLVSIFYRTPNGVVISYPVGYLNKNPGWDK